MSFGKPLTPEEIKARMLEAQQKQAVGEFEKFAEKELAEMTPQERKAFMEGRKKVGERRISEGK